ncbi:DUF418 domain-containing protein [Radiobacillus kanasensis]|uniref:DUF418 domain-containing protein n=1 Tax=Radiobacillus kanasensis TaxID=2844358 RepID=UPI001E65BDFA|nr:DUF418 domain-containing protein [Radiobacillus kanasensis]UFU00529.1 DUF418 domain-containing protein [Radiobacillus kanasensis]
MTQGTPLSERQRLSWIDAARGLAIFGIFMVNTPAFHAPYFLYGEAEQVWSQPFQVLIQNIIDIFFQASFYTLFSFLFGFGIQVMVDRLGEKELPFKRIIARRLGVLLGFGVIHAFLIWHGDILLSYGSIGFFLFAFFRRKDNTLLAWGLALLTIPTLLYTWLLFLVRRYLEGDMTNHSAVNASFDSYGNGSLFDVWTQNYQDWMYTNFGINFIFLIISLLPMFLIGIYFARKKWLHDVATHRRILVRVWWVTLFFFLVGKVAPYALDNPLWLSSYQDTIGGSASAIFYLITITLLYQKVSIAKWLKPLEYVGRMSLSNYLFQSIISFFLYYSIGFGLYGQITPGISVLIVIVIFFLQIMISRLWFRYFYYGPVEWLWRSLTYRQKQKMKKVPLGG